MKKEKIFFWIITFLTVGFVFAITFSGIINQPISDLDELWNFNTAKQIASGLIPYKEISMITTPLTASINAVLLNIIGVNVFNFRILTAIMVSMIALLTMVVCKELTGKKFFAFVTTTILTSMFLINYRMDYNVTTIILVLIILLAELKLKKKSSLINQLLIGFVAGLVVLNKQTLGLFVALAVALVPLAFARREKSKGDDAKENKEENKKENRKDNTKENKKEVLKNILYRILGMLIPIVAFIIYLWITNSLHDFIDYAILGIKHFDNQISYSNLIEEKAGGINVLAIMVPIIEVLTLLAIVIGRVSRRKGKQSLFPNTDFEKFQLLFVYSLPMLVVFYPIADKIHFLIGIYIVAILIMYELYSSINIIVSSKTTRIKYLTYVVVFIGLMVYPLYSNLIYLRDNYGEYSESKKSKIHNYENTVYSAFIEEMHFEIGDYIKRNNAIGYKVLILSASSAAVEIPIDGYNKNYSMFNKGNIGKDGEDGIIKEIQESEKCIYLVLKPKYAQNWQTPTKVVTYIRENLKLIESVHIYDCYVTEK